VIHAKEPLNVYIGYDSSQDVAYHACRQSMIDHGFDPALIHPLVQSELRQRGVYWRAVDEKASTEFSLTRFLVPFLNGYSGRSLFCDSDFLWRCNPMEVFEKYNDAKHNVHVVKHDLSADCLSSIKMDDKVQEWYPKKNWSSLMLFENKWCTSLTPKYVNEALPSQMHRFQWVMSEDRIGSVDPTYNSLVGYYGYDRENPRAVHFTDGGPWLKGYEGVPFAEEWRSVQQRT
jgi:hypothetical protein